MSSQTSSTGIPISSSSGFTSTRFEIMRSPPESSSATTAMKAMSDKEKMGLVHTLIDDAKMVLGSGKHNHEKAAAGAYDHARAIAKARMAKGYAEAAEMLANR